MLLYVLAAALSLPLGYCIFSWSLNTYSFLALYSPDHLFQETGDPFFPPEQRGTEIFQSLNAEIEHETRSKQGEEGWLLARLDRLWTSVRKYVSLSGEGEQQLVAATPRPPIETERAPPKPAASPGTETQENVLHNILSLAADLQVLQSATQDAAQAPPPAVQGHDPLPALASRSSGAADAEPEKATRDWLYRLESSQGLRTQSLIWQLNRTLALEGTVESKPIAETDHDLSDFGIRAVHALNFLRDRPVPAVMTGYNSVDSGYPLSYGIGLNYQASPLINLRFDYAHERPHHYLDEYRGSWESSLMTNFDKVRPENSLSVHTFFLGFRYLVQRQATRIPLHTGFFYSTNMDNEPLTSNTSLGFSLGGGINQRDFRLGLAYRFRIWENPENPFQSEDRMEPFEKRVSNQFLFTLVF